MSLQILLPSGIFLEADCYPSGTMATSFGAAAGIFAVFFFGDVPRVREDILVNLPMVGGLFEKPALAPEDNVSGFLGVILDDYVFIEIPGYS